MTGEMVIKFLDTMIKQIENLRNNIELDSILEFISSIQNAERIFVMGAGRSGFIAKAFAMRLMHLGYNVYVVGETVTPRIERNDILIAISGSGETSSIVSISKKAKEMIGSKLIAITGRRNSPLAEMSDVVVLLKAKLKTDEDEELSKIAPLGTMFELTSMIFLDAIIAELMKIKNMSEKDLAERHAVLE